MHSEPCFACGRDASGNYCSNCGTDLSPENERHWGIFDAHDRASETAVRKAEMDRRLYGEIADMPPLTAMVVRNCEAMSEPREVGSPDEMLFFPAVGPAKIGLRTELVIDMALSRL